LCVATVLSIISYSEGRSTIPVWKDLLLWSFPYHLIGASVALGIHHLMNAAGWIVIVLIAPFIYGIYAAYRTYFGRLNDQAQSALEVADLNLRTIEALARAIEPKDKKTNENLNRVRVNAWGLPK